MLRDLDAVEALAASLEGTAPTTVAEAGGVQALIAKYGHRTGAWFWSIAPVEVSLWEKMADEHQAKHRVSVGEERAISKTNIGSGPIFIGLIEVLQPSNSSI